MTGADLIGLLPIMVIAGAILVVMLAIAVRRRHSWTAGLTLLGLLATLATLPTAYRVAPRSVTPLLVVDGYALSYMGLLLLTTVGVTILAYNYLKPRAGRQEEFYLLLLLATLGALVLVSSSHFASFFLGLELLSVALFALIAYPVSHRLALEASMKYLVLAGVSSAFLLFGMALIYAQLGTMWFPAIGERLVAGAFEMNAYWLIGVTLILTGVGFKLALVPFHMWTPDIYEGAPAPVTAYVATVSKGAMLALLLRYFLEADAFGHGPVFAVLATIAFVSMIVGNLLALMQDNIKRVLAYSSIAHLGYALVAFLAAGTAAVEAVSFYLVFYFVTILGAFAVITLLSPPEALRDLDDLDDYRGLFWRRPWLAAAMSAMLFSLAGIPLTVGFIGKFYVVVAAAGAALWVLLITLVVGSAIGLYYYLRIVAAMYVAPEGDERPRSTPAQPIPLSGAVVLALLSVLLFWFGVYPSPLIEFIRATVVNVV